MKLEELARQSSDAARASVIHLEPPPIADRRSRWITVGLPSLAGVASLVLVLSVALAIGGGGSDESTTISAADAVEVPRLGFADLDPSWELDGAMDLGDLAADEMGTRPGFTYLGAGTDDDPFADGDLVIVTLPGAADDLSGSAETSPVELRGTTGQLASGPDEGLPEGSTLLLWTEIPPPGESVDAISVGLASRSLDGNELVAIAESLEIDPSRGYRAVAIPDDLGLEAVAVDTAGPFGVFVPGMTDGSLLTYERSVDDTPESLVLVATDGTLDEVRATYLWWSPNAVEVTVDGKPGFRTVVDETQTGMSLGQTVVWQWDQGVIATVIHAGSASVDAVGLAEQVIELDDATWADLVAMAGLPQVDAASFDDIYRQQDGGFENGLGYQWILGLRQEQLCFELNVDDSGFGSCQEPPSVDPGTARTIDNSFSDELVTVLIVADRAVESVMETTNQAPLDRIDAPDGNTYWVYVGPPDVQPSFDVIVGGELVDTLEAGVEAEAEGITVAESIDVAANPSAQAMGIVDDFEIIGTGGELEDVQWAVGTVAGDLCLITDGEAVTAGCQPFADIVVFQPTQLTDGSDLTFIVATDPPPCLEVRGLSAVTSISTSVFSTREGDTHVLAASGVAEGWRLLLADGTADVWVDLPDIGGGVAWPSDACA